MRARWWVNVVLLLVLGGLVLAIRHEVIRESTPPVLAELERDDLQQVSVERVAEPKIRLERTMDGWRMREPMDTDAEQGQVDRLLEVLSAPVRRSFPAKAAAPAELGLEPPKIVLSLDGLRLSFGSLDPVTQRRYVGSDGLVHLIDDRYYAALIAPPLDYVSRDVATRGHPPAFATLNGVPLAAASLKVLAGLRAERVETLAGALEGEPLVLKSADGTPLRFLISEDRRRLSRPDSRVRYVLSDPTVLELDPTAVDKTPAAAPAPESFPSVGAEDRGPVLSGQTSAPAQGTGLDGSGLSPPLSDPNAPVSGDAPLGTPPAVRLSPHQASEGPQDGFGAEPYKQPPEGFGTDPFAPDPAYDPGAGGGPEGR